MELYSLFKKHPVICTDSRICPQGSIFFALRGDNFNANAFAKNALLNGCAYAVVDDADFAIDERYVLVENVLDTLQQLATYHRKQLGTTIIGITGTNGKTTSKELIASVLKEKYNIHFTQGNLNNHIGVPLTLLQLRPEHQLAVVEMGANHPGEIKTLCRIACPDVGLITNVGKAHLEGFGSFEGVKATKSELYEYIQHHGKAIFINEDNAHLMEIAANKGFASQHDRLIKYSLENNTTNVYGQISSCSPFLSMTCKIDSVTDCSINTQLIGSYNAENVLAAITIAHYFDVNAEQIKHGLENYVPKNNRSQLTVTETNKLVVDAYNANPTSMRAAIHNFGEMAVEHKVLILGDMLELGEQSETEHQEIIQLLESYHFDRVILVGSFFAASKHSFLSFAHVDQAIQYLTEHAVANSYVLIKGSRGIKLEKVLNIL
jgi:UDP-N-acetylmuramoyl-tripeptide--D-alanyl-D-alanine ligase